MFFFFFVLFFVVVGDIRMLDVWHFYFFLSSAPFRHFQNSNPRQLPDSLVLIAIASFVLSVQVEASFGSVKAPAFRLHALVSLIPAVQSSSSQPASHLKHLLVLKSTRRRRSLVCHIPTWMTDGRRMCDDVLSQWFSLGIGFYCISETSCAVWLSVGIPFAFHQGVARRWWCVAWGSELRKKDWICWDGTSKSYALLSEGVGFLFF